MDSIEIQNSKPTIQDSTSLSVVISTYNYGRFLGEAIESVLGQTLPPAEIIVVDDGSTDDTAEIVERYADRGVRYIYKENGGPSSARNLGIKESAGELIAFLDADDRWAPDKLARQVEHLRLHPKVGLVTGGEWQTDEAGRVEWRLDRKRAESTRIYPQILVENIIGSPSLVMLRRKCFRRAGVFDEEIYLAQDWDLWIRVAREYPVAVLGGEPLIYYRRHGASISSSGGSVWKRYRSNRAFQRRYIRSVQPATLRLRLLMSAQSMNLFYTAAALSDTGTRRGMTLLLITLAALLDPTYRGKLKLGLLLRTAVGEGVLRRLRHAS